MNSFKDQIKKSAYKFTVGGFRPADSPYASWFGKILLGMPGENWPLNEGKPMTPICQVNLEALDHPIRGLEDIAFLTLFVGPDNLPIDEPNGSSWVLRTYTSTSDLVPLPQLYEADKPKPFQMLAEPVMDYPSWEDCPIPIPDDLTATFSEECPNHPGIKFGGWPMVIQDVVEWEHPKLSTSEFEFVFQIDSVAKSNWYWGDDGIAYIGRGKDPEQRNEWVLSWQCL